MQQPLPNSFLQLLLYMRPFRRIYVSAIFYSFFNKLFDLMPEILLGIAVNTVVAREGSWLGNLGIHDLKIQLEEIKHRLGEHDMQLNSIYDDIHSKSA